MKSVGIGLCVVLLCISVDLLFYEQSRPGGLILLLTAFMVGFFGFIAGVLTAAVGQFLSAAIDIAVNTSENVSAGEKAEIIFSRPAFAIKSLSDWLLH